MLSWHDFEANVSATLHLLDEFRTSQEVRLVNLLQT